MYFRLLLACGLPFLQTMVLTVFLLWFFYCWFLVSVLVTSHLTFVRIILVMIRLLSGHLFGRLTPCSLCTRGSQSHLSQELEILSIILKIK